MMKLLFLMVLFFISCGNTNSYLRESFENNMENQGTEFEFNDKNIAGAIKTEFQVWDYIPPASIEVKVGSGLVILKGPVTDVKNYVAVQDENSRNYFSRGNYPEPVVTDTTTKSDHELEKDIRSQLWWSRYVNQNEIKVTVDNRVTTLEGSVDSRRDRYCAELNAFEAGAINVENKTDIRRPSDGNHE